MGKYRNVYHLLRTFRFQAKFCLLKNQAIKHPNDEKFAFNRVFMALVG